ncbi:MAG: hypothetical protein LBN96_08110 [Desulfovibrio sp.]|jgi:tetratricopeptide (TPR) repeat protein|nr:hypothetical protein [Desulfovibrio sp.]
MTEKIEWYKEILELEPNSKLFFPLARLLTAENRCNEAIDVLEQGLERHPEFLEARLLFIELLYKADRRPHCAVQIDRISAVFSGYTEFWQAWAACLAADGGSPAMSTILRFVAAHFRYPLLSLHEVFDKGITAILGSQTAGSPQPAATESISESVADVQEPSRKSASEPVLQNGEPPADELPAGEQESPEGQSAKTAVSSDEAEEHFSLRTRSMAEVLAEQGDVKGALDIYQELAAAATIPVERADLLQRIATLNAKLIAMADAAPAAQTASETETATEKIKLINKLEALAERVEARARG